MHIDDIYVQLYIMKKIIDEEDLYIYIYIYTYITLPAKETA